MCSKTYLIYTDMYAKYSCIHDWFIELMWLNYFQLCCSGSQEGQYQATVIKSRGKGAQYGEMMY